MSTRLHVRTKAAPTPPRTIAEVIDVVIDHLYSLRPIAENERRSHAQTEELVDSLTGLGRVLHKAGRG